MTIRSEVLNDLINAYTMEGVNSPNSPNSPSQGTSRRHEVGNEGNDDILTPPKGTVGNNGNGDYGGCGEYDEDFPHEVDETQDGRTLVD
jgi:hypothetical protein